MQAIEHLRNPHPFPAQLRYLHQWALELHARSGMSEVGVNTITWATLDAWARRAGHDPTAQESEALFALDLAMMRPLSDDTNG